MRIDEADPAAHVDQWAYQLRTSATALDEFAKGPWRAHVLDNLDEIHETVRKLDSILTRILKRA